MFNKVLLDFSLVMAKQQVSNKFLTKHL